MWLLSMVVGDPTVLHGIQGCFLLRTIIILNSPQGMNDDVLKKLSLDKREQHPLHDFNQSVGRRSMRE